MRFSLSIAVALGLLVCAGIGEAAAKRSTAKKSTAKKSTAKAAHPASKTAKSSKKTRGKKTLTVARRATQRTPSSERYMVVQQALADRGYYQGAINGDWGSDSVDALKRFQADQKLKVDGRLGSLSLIALGLGPKRDPISALTARPETPPNP